MVPTAHYRDKAAAAAKIIWHAEMNEVSKNLLPLLLLVGLSLLLMDLTDTIVFDKATINGNSGEMLSTVILFRENKGGHQQW